MYKKGSLAGLCYGIAFAATEVCLFVILFWVKDRYQATLFPPDAFFRGDGHAVGLGLVLPGVPLAILGFFLPLLLGLQVQPFRRIILEGLEKDAKELGFSASPRYWVHIPCIVLAMAICLLIPVSSRFVRNVFWIGDDGLYSMSQSGYVTYYDSKHIRYVYTTCCMTRGGKGGPRLILNYSYSLDDGTRIPMLAGRCDFAGTPTSAANEFLEKYDRIRRALPVAKAQMHAKICQACLGNLYDQFPPDKAYRLLAILSGQDLEPLQPYFNVFQPNSVLPVGPSRPPKH